MSVLSFHYPFFTISNLSLILTRESQPTVCAKILDAKAYKYFVTLIVAPLSYLHRLNHYLFSCLLLFFFFLLIESQIEIFDCFNGFFKTLISYQTLETKMTHCIYWHTMLAHHFQNISCLLFHTSNTLYVTGGFTFDFQSME